MFTPINGFTKESMIETFKANFKGLSMDKHEDTCMYRGVNGTKCAVGCFIPDEMYSTYMENKNAAGLFRDHKELVELMPLVPDGMYQFQNAHDLLSTSATMEEQTQALLLWIETNVIG